MLYSFNAQMESINVWQTVKGTHIRLFTFNNSTMTFVWVPVDLVSPKVEIENIYIVYKLSISKIMAADLFNKVTFSFAEQVAKESLVFY